MGHGLALLIIRDMQFGETLSWSENLVLDRLLVSCRDGVRPVFLRRDAIVKSANFVFQIDLLNIAVTLYSMDVE